MPLAQCVLANAIMDPVTPIVAMYRALMLPMLVCSHEKVNFGAVMSSLDFCAAMKWYIFPLLLPSLTRHCPNNTLTNMCALTLFGGNHVVLIDAVTQQSIGMH